LENDFALGAALYPTTVEEAFAVITVYEGWLLYKAIIETAEEEYSGKQF
jgi:hypothetical protein